MNKFASLGAACGEAVMLKVAAGEWAMPSSSFAFDPRGQDQQVADAMRRQRSLQESMQRQTATMNATQNAAQGSANATQGSANATQGAANATQGAANATQGAGSAATHPDMPKTPTPPGGEKVPAKKGFFSRMKGKFGLAMGAASFGIPTAMMLWNKFSGNEPTMEQQGYVGSSYF